MMTLHHDPGQLRVTRCWPFLLAALLFFISPAAFAVTGEIDLTTSAVGFFAVAIFVLAYSLVMAEEKIHMRKSKPVLVAAGIIWGLIGWDSLAGVQYTLYMQDSIEYIIHCPQAQIIYFN